MYTARVALAKTDTPLPDGKVFGHTNLTVTDADGAVQVFALNGSETPPWTQVVTIAADGASSYSAQDVDANGDTLGSPQTTTYTPSAAPATFAATSGISVGPVGG